MICRTATDCKFSLINQRCPFGPECLPFCSLLVARPFLAHKRSLSSGSLLPFFLSSCRDLASHLGLKLILRLTAPPRRPHPERDAPPPRHMCSCAGTSSH